MTSRRATATRLSEMPRVAFGSAPYSVLTGQIFHAGRAFLIVEDHARRQRVHVDGQPPRKSRGHVQHAFARSDALMVLRRHREVSQSDGALGHAPRVVGIGQAVEPRLAPEGAADFAERRTDGLQDHVPQIAILDGRVGDGVLRRQPPGPPVPARVDPELAEKAFPAAMTAVFQALEVRAHVLGAPRTVACRIRQLVPVRIVRVNKNERVVGSTAAERRGARVEHAIDSLAVVHFTVLAVAPLLLVVVVVADEEVPAELWILGRAGIEGRDVVVGARDVARIAAGLEQHDAVPGLSQPGGDGTAAGAGSDDDVVGFVAIRRGRRLPARATESPDRKGAIGRGTRSGRRSVRRGPAPRHRGAQHQPGPEEVATPQPHLRMF